MGEASLLDLYTKPVKYAERPILGREKEMRRVKAALMRPELCNVMLLAPAGSGKTALVQGTMASDPERKYLEVDLAKMISDAKDANELASMLKLLFDETAETVRTGGQEIVLFIDEFHQIVQLSAAAVEALKPLLADSGTRGIRVIAATTYIEFREYIAKNQPLVERLQRINLPEPGRDVVLAILENMVQRYGAEDAITDPSIYGLIYDYTNRYIPSNAQPRKSLIVMDAMLGWHRAEGREMDQSLLADVIYESEGVNVAFRVDAGRIKSELDKRVLSQEFATAMIEERLQICVADLNDKSRPMSSFLFSGASGVGKAIDDDMLVPYMSSDGRSWGYKRHGDIVVGDFVFNRVGKPVRVTAVYPQGIIPAYEVRFSDGRTVVCNSEHLWTWSRRYGCAEPVWRTTTLDEMVRQRKRGNKIDACVQANAAVDFPDRVLPVDPYVLGAFIGDGCLTSDWLQLCTDDEFVAKKVCSIIGAADCMRSVPNRAGWKFVTGTRFRSYGRMVNGLVHTSDVFGNVPEVFNHYANEKRIPECYFSASVSQRFALLQGLMDTDGSIHDGRLSGNKHRWSVCYSTISKGLADDVIRLVQSLGFSATLSVNRCSGHRATPLYVVWILSHVCDKVRFFTLPRRLELAKLARDQWLAERWRTVAYDRVGIDSVTRLPRNRAMTCIMVDDAEHLYQLGNGIVTHNTAVSKCLAELLFQDSKALIRVDCTEFANPESLERFRRELTAQVWARPFSIVLLDEIEKACSQVTRLLLQVLDDGRLMDENNRIVSFLNCYIIMTTNAGSEVYKTIAQYSADDTGSGKGISQYYKLIRESITKTTGDNKFPPELLGRINVIVPFQPLSEATMKQIARMNILKMKSDIKAKHGIEVGVHPDIIRFLVEDNLDTDADSGGARTVIAKLESEVTIPIARFINAHPGCKYLKVDLKGTLVRDDPNSRVSSAYVVVSEADAKARA